MARKNKKPKGPAQPRNKGRETLTIEEYQKRFPSGNETTNEEPAIDAEDVEIPQTTQRTGEKIAEKNLHYLFFADYYEQLRPYLTGGRDEDILKATSELNESFADTKFHPGWQPQQELTGSGYQSFDLETTYPGLLAGTGLPHQAGVKGELTIGFNFDYVTGLPYLPGSTVKGVLRSGFRLGDYAFARELSPALQGAPDGVMQALERDIFDRETGGDMFFDAYPVVDRDGPLLDTDNLAPVPTDPESSVPVADQRRIKAPTVLAFLRVRPGVKFRFVFYLTDSTVPAMDGGTTFTLSAGAKKWLFQNLILELGMGAKTNVGYGRMVKPKPKPKQQ